MRTLLPFGPVKSGGAEFPNRGTGSDYITPRGSYKWQGLSKAEGCPVLQSAHLILNGPGRPFPG